MKIIGIVFIVISSISMGLRIGSALKKKCTHLQELLNALELFKNELLFSHKPLPKVCADLAESFQEGVGRMFANISLLMEENRWMSFKTAMERALGTYPDELPSEILLEFAGNMGKYDLDAQVRGIELASSRIRQILDVMENERGTKSKTYKTLSICAGIAIIILFV